jgi:hypothetical protein
MGFSIGSLLAMCSSQILRDTFFVNVGWLVPTILILFISSYKKRLYKHNYRSIEKPGLLESGVLICALLLSLTYWWFWLWPIVALLAVFLITKKYAKNILWFVAIILPTSVTLISTSIYLKGLNSFWRVWSHDQIFLEAMSYSAAKWGPAENIHSVGIEFKYHWLSLAWSGATAAAANSEPLFITTITLPIVALFGSVLILYAIAKYLTSAKYLPLLVVAVFVYIYGFNNCFKRNTIRNGSFRIITHCCIWGQGFPRSCARRWYRINDGVLVLEATYCKRKKIRIQLLCVTGTKHFDRLPVSLSWNVNWKWRNAFNRIWPNWRGSRTCSK